MKVEDILRHTALTEKVTITGYESGYPYYEGAANEVPAEVRSMTIRLLGGDAIDYIGYDGCLHIEVGE